MLATFVIGLREGVEAALIVGIVAAFLHKRGRSDLLPSVWIGVTVAALLCLAVAIGLQVLNAGLPQQQQEALETIVGAAAVAMVTYMVLWMARHSRLLKGQLETAAADALARGSAWALVAMAFAAVLREGLETAVFLLATVQASGNALLATLGAVLGLGSAFAIGVGLYRGAVHINLARFFRATSFVLILVAAGLVMTCLHTAHEAGWLNVGQAPTIDLRWLLQPGSVQAAVLTGMLGLQPRPTQIEVVGWVLYAAIVLALVLIPQQRRTLLRPVGTALAAVMLLFPSVVLGAQSDSPTTVTVTLTNDGCLAEPASVGAGSVTFQVNDTTGDQVSEVELLHNDVIVGEKENLFPGSSGSFSINLPAGDYELYCPGADTEMTTFTVAATVVPASTATVDSAVRADFDQATTGYRAYVQQEVVALVTSTQAFANAVAAGDLAAARQLYPAAHSHYAAIEPVAERFGDLDPAIDMREDDASDPSQFTGFHRLEKALWQENDLTGMTPTAQRLVADTQKLQELFDNPVSFAFDAADVANGSAELLDEVARTRVTGEEERYSGLDLLDMSANIDGSRKGFELLRPGLTRIDPALASTIAARFDALDAAIAPYRNADGSWKRYAELQPSDIQSLSGAVGGVAEPLSQVAARIVVAGAQSDTASAQ
jgi:FTR1 family protein